MPRLSALGRRGLWEVKGTISSHLVPLQVHPPSCCFLGPLHLLLGSSQRKQWIETQPLAWLHSPSCLFLSHGRQQSLACVTIILRLVICEEPRLFTQPKTCALGTKLSSPGPHTEAPRATCSSSSFSLSPREGTNWFGLT